MRIRSIKPEFWRSDDTASLTDWHWRLIFLGLWSYVDDNGVGRDNAALIQSDLFPQESDPAEVLARITRALDELSRRKLIVRYTVENRAYLFITGWRHQKIDRPSLPRYPEPPTCEDGTFDESSTNTREPASSPRSARAEDQGSGIRDQGGNPRAKSTRGTRIPEDFSITEPMVDWANKNVPGMDLAIPTKKFVNHFQAQSGARGVMIDWVAAWRKWMLGDYKPGGSMTGRPAPVLYSARPGQMAREG